MNAEGREKLACYGKKSLDSWLDCFFAAGSKADGTRWMPDNFFNNGTMLIMTENKIGQNGAAQTVFCHSQQRKIIRQSESNVRGEFKLLA